MPSLSNKEIIVKFENVNEQLFQLYGYFRDKMNNLGIVEDNGLNEYSKLIQYYQNYVNTRDYTSALFMLKKAQQKSTEIFGMVGIDEDKAVMLSNINDVISNSIDSFDRNVNAVLKLTQNEPKQNIDDLNSDIFTVEGLKETYKLALDYMEKLQDAFSQDENNALLSKDLNSLAQIANEYKNSINTAQYYDALNLVKSFITESTNIIKVLDKDGEKYSNIDLEVLQGAFDRYVNSPEFSKVISDLENEAENEVNNSYYANNDDENDIYNENEIDNKNEIDNENEIDNKEDSKDNISQNDIFKDDAAENIIDNKDGVANIEEELNSLKSNESRYKDGNVNALRLNKKTPEQLKEFLSVNCNDDKKSLSFFKEALSSVKSTHSNSNYFLGLEEYISQVIDKINELNSKNAAENKAALDDLKSDFIALKSLSNKYIDHAHKDKLSSVFSSAGVRLRKVAVAEELNRYIDSVMGKIWVGEDLDVVEANTNVVIGKRISNYQEFVNKKDTFVSQIQCDEAGNIIVNKDNSINGIEKNVAFAALSGVISGREGNKVLLNIAMGQGFENAANMFVRLDCVKNALSEMKTVNDVKAFLENKEAMKNLSDQMNKEIDNIAKNRNSNNIDNDEREINPKAENVEYNNISL